jgi:hypothetical protein
MNTFKRMRKNNRSYLQPILIKRKRVKHTMLHGLNNNHSPNSDLI